MESIGLYLLKSAVWLTGFALVFLIVLRNERYFLLNRIYLLSGIVASIAFPFYTWHYTIVLPVQEAYTTTSGISEVAMAPPAPPIPVYFWFYVVGIAGLALRMIWQTGKVVSKLRKAGYVKTDSIKLVRTTEYAASFSFFSYVFVNPSITDIEMEEIVNHEREHIGQRHWFDLLLVELLCMLQWFNPFVWIYARLIRQNHEYLADEMALQHTSNPAIYRATLLNQLFDAPVISLANSFSYSLNKKRFKMMKKKIDSPFRKLKILLVLPFVAMVFYAFAEPAYITSEPSPSTDKNATVTEALNKLTVPLTTPAVKRDTVNQVKKVKVIKGKVVNPAGKPLGGTTVIISGTNTGVVADKDGNFKIKNVPKGAELVFSMEGYQSMIVKSDAGNAMLIKLEEAAVVADEHVYVGYPITKHVTFKSKFADKNPLYFLNGTVIDKTKMDALNPEDISSVEVLKDQSATSLYGDTAKNGVVRISTKNNFMNDPLKDPLFLLDGEIINRERMNALDPNTILSINVSKGESAIAKYGNKARNGAIEITLKYQLSTMKSLNSIEKPSKIESIDPLNPPLYILDNVITEKAVVDKVLADGVESVSVWKGKEAIEKYGEKGKNGVVEIVTKKNEVKDK